MSLSACLPVVPLLLSLTSSAAPSGSGPDWLPAFGGALGTDDAVQALTTFDDGSGEALYAGGEFVSVAGEIVNFLGKWDGTEWSAVGGGMTGPSPSGPSNGMVSALTVFDDGSGPALYAGGSFIEAGGTPAVNVARWDGSSWSPVGNGLPSILTFRQVAALVVFDDGTGPALYAGGSFVFVNGSGETVNRVARWDGQDWSPLGSGVSMAILGNQARVDALTVFDDGTGPVLVAGGRFLDAGGQAVENLASWDGTQWSSVGGGVDGSVLALAAHDDGSGERLFVGGNFFPGNGIGRSLAAWDGSQWADLDGGVNSGSVCSFYAYDDGGGAALYAGGSFSAIGGITSPRVSRWDGSGWSILPGGGLFSGSLLGGNQVDAFCAYPSGPGSLLFAGGGFSCTNATAAKGIATWNGSQWSAVAGENAFENVFSTVVFDDGNGPALYAAGNFAECGNEAEMYVARRDGDEWQPLGSGMDGFVFDLLVHDDGSGPALFASGNFSVAGSVGANNIAKWDGTDWSALGSGTNGSASVMLAFDDGNGVDLYVGGSFTEAGGLLAAKNIARWDGSSWSGLSNGVSGSVRALATFDDGTGPALYAGGSFFFASGLPVKRVAKWDGTSWTGLGLGGPDVGVSAGVETLATFDDGSGEALYIGGGFEVVLGAPGSGISDIARWDGSAFSAVDQGALVNVIALAAFDGDLYASGQFTSASSNTRLGRWDGQSWTPIAGDIVGGSIQSLAALDLGDGVALYAAGTFDASVAGDSWIARYGCPPEGPSPYCTAKVSSAGCVASVSTSDLALHPVSGAGDYFVTATDVQEGKNGILFVGISGAAAIPFSGGTLCVLPPTKRSPVMNSGGVNPLGCNGSFDTLVNDGSIVPAGLDAGSGNTGWYQFWYRDPANGAGVLGSAMSNGIALDFE